MGLKFLNKKGWHTGSLRNIENVWKAEQKHEGEQRKLEELRKQIHEERERDQFRLLQEQAGLTPRQERLEFLYDSGLAVGRSTSDGFKALQPSPSASAPAPAPSSEPDSSKSSVPGALFEDKPQSANDAWRKLHSDPLLMIRQREQEALARIKNNPVKMAVIRKSVEANKKNDESLEEEHQKVKSKHRKHSTSKYDSDSENDSHEETERKEKEKKKKKDHLDSDKDSRDRPRHHRHSHRDHEGEKQRHSSPSKHKSDRNQEDARDRERHDNRHSRRDHGSDVEKQRHSSPSKHKSDRSQEDARDRERHDNRHSRRDHGSEDVEKQRHSSPSKHKLDRSQEDARDRERHDNSRRDHGSEDVEKQQHSSPSKHKSDRSQEDARDRERHNNRHSRRDYGSEDVERNKRSYEKAKHEDNPQDHQNDKYEYKARNNGSSRQVSDSNHSGLPPRPDSYKRRGRAPQLSEEERAARLREMQMDAEVHEEQRWKRLKKADEDDVREASHANNSNRGSSFLDSVQKSVYGAEKGGSSTIEESVRRRAHFLQGSREATERNAFRR